mmetsp:Transcript_13607/g.15019  ORF Transcript_13607/g.15019 Transcript_13607/m.15019 type:complete len:136 (-) Transcript_13607:81-488(-)|eukprot:CAMPEP_0168523564 /NCGR_PEP_ID=MMETSP0405-20121227/10058_1 /TAXON_ID=498012 /ORGANISM="Trichosphaerium sp, Strain Am-I-7 wt" /LENGTH=135 /DNA_ID=CAMNT_0008545461 /DNA_START=22 /DNA_END=429 /DNA_ORIENTATION=-
MSKKAKVSKSKAGQAAKSGAKAAKKKWSKGKVSDKLDNNVLFPEDVYTRFCTEVPKMKFITLSIISEKYKVRATVATRALKQLEKEGKVKLVGDRYKKILIWTRTAEPVEKPAATKGGKSDKGKKATKGKKGKGK